MDEYKLVKNCQNGNDAARKKLYEQYAQRMLALCFRYTNDMDVAHDLLHDGFLQIYSGIASFEWRGEGSFRAWTSRIFANVCLAYLRKKDLLRNTLTLDVVNALPNEPEPDITPLSTDILMQFVTELPAGYRAVFNLFVFEEWSHREIAAQLKINEKSSSSQLLRARKLLIKRIKEYINKHG